VRIDEIADVAGALPGVRQTSSDGLRQWRYHEKPPETVRPGHPGSRRALLLARGQKTAVLTYTTN
jgi:hypothetical protein